MKAISHYWPKEYLFLLTHGDWCVPTLSALLTQHLGVQGCGCSGLAYDHPSDLMRLRWLIARSDRNIPSGRYLFDALVSNEQYLPLQLTASPSLRVLICIQRPAETLLSMLNGGTAQSLSEAEYLYRGRLEWLAAAGPNLGERALVFPVEMVTEATNTLLAAIALHTHMEQVFKPVAQSLLDNDEVFGESPPRRAVVGVGPRVLERCEESYDEALLELSRTCLSVGIAGVSDAGPEPYSVCRPRAIPVPACRTEPAPTIVCHSLSEGTLQ